MFLKKATIYVSLISMLFRPTSEAPERSELEIADNNVQVVSSYIKDDELNCFVDIPSDDAKALKAVLSTDVSEETSEAEISTVVDKKNDVHYLFVINSDSESEDYVSIAKKYAGTLMNFHKSSSFEITKISSNSELTYDELENKDALDDYFSNVTAADFSNDLKAVLDNIYAHVSDYQFSEAEIYNVVFITDGNSDIISESNKFLDSEAAHPEVAFSVISVGETSVALGDVLSSVKGYSKIVSSEADAEEAAKENATKIKGLSVVTFPVENIAPDTKVAISLSFADADGNEIYSAKVENVPSFKGSEMLESPEIGNDDSSNEATDSSDDESEDANKGDDADEGDKAEISEGDGADSEDALSNPDEADDETDDEDADKGNFFEEHLTLLIIICLVGMLIIIILLILVVKQSNNKSKNAKTKGNVPRPQLSPEPVETRTVSPVKLNASANVGPQIPISFELVSGQSNVNTGNIMMGSELTIGSSLSCDIAFNDTKVQDFHAKITNKNGVFYLEDMNSLTGTYLEGMRIQKTNKIASGDLLSVGDCEFIIRF